MDNFKAVYKILSALEKTMDLPELDVTTIGHEKLGVSKESSLWKSQDRHRDIENTTKWNSGEVLNNRAKTDYSLKTALTNMALSSIVFSKFNILKVTIFLSSILGMFKRFKVPNIEQKYFSAISLFKFLIILVY